MHGRRPAALQDRRRVQHLVEQQQLFDRRLELDVFEWRLVQLPVLELLLVIMEQQRRRGPGNFVQQCYPSSVAPTTVDSFRLPEPSATCNVTSVSTGAFAPINPVTVCCRK